MSRTFNLGSRVQRRREQRRRFKPLFDCAVHGGGCASRDGGECDCFFVRIDAALRGKEKP